MLAGFIQQPAISFAHKVLFILKQPIRYLKHPLQLLPGSGWKHQGDSRTPSHPHIW
jgi:hypothetical protein